MIAAIRGNNFMGAELAAANKTRRYLRRYWRSKSVLLLRKAGKHERNAGLDGFPIDRPDKRTGKGLGMWDEKGIAAQKNHHPCVKPIRLTEWLARLILPPERPEPRKILVPYCGSGSEMIGAMLAGWDEVWGIERQTQYVEIAKKRIQAAREIMLAVSEKHPDPDLNEEDIHSNCSELYGGSYK